MDRAKWYQWHSCLGLKLAILVCFVLITGTFAVLSHEIDWLTNPAMRADTSNSRPVQWETVYASASTQFADASLESLSVKEDPWFAAEAIYVDAQGTRFRGFFHPVTGNYQGDGRWFNWQRFFRMAHRHLMLPLPIGVTVVCIVGLMLFGSLISGTVIYKGWWKGFLRWPRTKNAKVFWGDMHRLLGVWVSWLMLVLCITGMWYLVEQWGARATYPELGKPKAVLNAEEVQETSGQEKEGQEKPERDGEKPQSQQTIPGTGPIQNVITGTQQPKETTAGTDPSHEAAPGKAQLQKAISGMQHPQTSALSLREFADMLATARQQRPDIHISNIRFPGKSLNVVLFEGQGGELLVRDRANNIVLDPADGEVLSMRHADALSLHVRISEAADPLHFGYFGGFTTKIIYFTFGLMLSGLAVAGTWIYALRISRRRNPHKARNIWKGMQWGGWLSVLFVLVCLFNTGYVFL